MPHSHAHHAVGFALTLAMLPSAACSGCRKEKVHPATAPSVEAPAPHTAAAPAAQVNSEAFGIPKGSYLASIVCDGKVVHASWLVAAHGPIRASRPIADVLSVDQLARDREIDLRAMRANALPLQLPPPAPSANPPRDDSFRSLPLASVEVRFSEQDEAGQGAAGQDAAGQDAAGQDAAARAREPAWLQWYGGASGARDDAILVVPRPQPMVIVLDTILRSPDGPWLAPSVGDIDGDTIPDVAFVAEGVGTCGGEATPDCPLWWIDIRMTSANTLWRAGATLLENAEVEAFERDVGADSVRWHGRIESGSYDITASGPKGARHWAAVLDEGVLRIEGRAVPARALAPHSACSRDRMGMPWGSQPSVFSKRGDPRPGHPRSAQPIR